MSIPIPNALQPFSQATDTFSAFTPRNINGKYLFRFGFTADNEEKIENVHRFISRFLKENRSSANPYIPTFNPSLESFKKRCTKFPEQYLIFWSQAVSLTRQSTAPKDAPKEIRDCFSETLLKKPVSCQKSHHFEQKRLAKWLENGGKGCPAGKHEINPSEIDSQTQEMVTFYHERKDKECAMLADIETAEKQLSKVENDNKKLQEQIDQKSKQLDQLNIQLNQLDTNVAATAAKTFFSKLQVLSLMGSMLAKAKSKVGALPSRKTMAKTVFMSFVIGIACACYRLPSCFGKGYVH